MVSAETKTRLITAVKWVPTVGFVTLYSKLLFNIFICLIVVGALREYRVILNYVWPSQAGFGKEINPGKPTFMLMDYCFFALGFILSVVASFGDVILFNIASAFCLNALFSLHFLIVTASRKQVDTHTLYQLMVYFFGFMYIAWPLAHGSLLHAIPKYGPGLAFMTLYCSWWGDGMGYFIGKKFGQNRLVPYISPGKSVEGFVVNIVASTMPLILVYYLKHQHQIWVDLLPPMNFTGYLILGTAYGVIGPIGDLLESYLKRAAGVKDSGDFFPGHGGMLDRFDTFLLLVPLIYYSLILIYDF